MFVNTFLKIILLIFIFQSFTKADDIRDLEVEGISLGENALDYFSKNDIDQNKSYYPNDKEIWRYLVILKNKQYDSLQLHLQSKNNKYLVVGVAGLIYFYDEKDAYSKCIKKRSLIVNDIEQSLINVKKSDEERDNLISDDTGKSYVEAIYFDFKEDLSEYVKVACTYFSDEYREKTNHPPSYLRVALTSTQLHYWLKEKAF